MSPGRITTTVITITTTIEGTGRGGMNHAYPVDP
jgi:hypothetical protein